jgi:hypothetical protein
MKASKHSTAGAARVALGLVAAVLAGSCSMRACGGKPAIPLAEYGTDYRTKLDFARLEHKFPLTRADLMKLTPANVELFNQEEIDQVYARLTAGPIPDGAYRGTFFFSEGAGLKRMPEILGGLLGKAADVKVEFLERLGGKLWQGKVFYRDKRELRNMITDRASVDWLLRTLNVDEKSLTPTKTPDGKDAWLLFPAKLYCGQSLLDGRRESIIIDYAFTDEQPGYRAGIDSLGGRNGTQIRDEIRMVRPGFYLGRAYLSRVFALNFTLENDKVEKEASDAFLKTGRIEEDCWPGHQRLTASN